jgi:hypothetical protein
MPLLFSEINMSAIAEVGTFLLGIGVFVNAVLSLVTMLLTFKATKVVTKLEENTNSIKDALVKVTAESSKAEGILEGRAQILDQSKEP